VQSNYKQILTLVFLQNKTATGQEQQY